MGKPAGYVGYTMPQGIFFKTCVTDHVNPKYSPSQTNVITAAKGRGSFSLFEFAIELNNNKVAIPAGHVFVAHLVYSWTRHEPCGTQRPKGNNDYYEKFGATALDIQNFITGCESQVVDFERTVEYALIADPEPATAIPDKEYAVQLAHITAQQKTDFAAAVTLKLTIKYTYDNCHKPPTTPTQKPHYLEFTAVTLDPNQNKKVTWTLPNSPEKHSE